MFTTTDYKFIQSSTDYFCIINVSPRYIELKSFCTGHYWLLNDSGYGVLIYHKHNANQGTSYHPQAYYLRKIPHNLQGAILAIKHHDTYYLTHHNTKK